MSATILIAGPHAISVLLFIFRYIDVNIVLKLP